jgi:hypothetical protein
MKFLFSILSICISTFLIAQTPIDVTESTLKIRAIGDEVFYCGFAEGDQVIFNFEEVNGKELKEVEIIEMPSTSRFMDYKTTSIINKTLTITKTGIYKFRFSNAAIGGRICKYKIQRIPASDATKNFNTSVYYKTIYDTTYTTEQEKYLVKKDTTIITLTDQVAKVHSSTNLDGNKTTLNFTLPANTVSWSYYIGVDQSGQDAYEQATKNLAKKAGPIVSRIPGYGPMAALALGGASFLTAAQTGEDIDYYIVQGENVNLFGANQQFYYVKKGKVINDYSRMTENYKGQYHVCLMNDNAITGVSVAVKITAIVVKEEWGTRPIQKMHVTSREEAYLKN